MDDVIEIVEEKRDTVFHMIPPVNIGEHSYIGGHSHIAQHTEIGKFCGIGNLCTIGAQPHHPEYMANYPIELLSTEKPSPKSTIIGNDVWIGSNSVVLAGLKIGDGAVIGAGSVVTKDVAPYAIVAGNPAKVLRFRFKFSIIKALRESKWWEMGIEEIRSLPLKDVSSCIEQMQFQRQKVAA